MTSSTTCCRPSPPSLQRIITLIDMDCFYVQVEERDNPEIVGKPAAVVQYKAYKGGGIIAVNYEARAKGVSRNMRGDDAKAACPEIILVRVPETRGKADLTKYRDAGMQVIQVLSDFSSTVERASIDEAYIDLTDEVDRRIAGQDARDIIKGLKRDYFVGSHVFGTTMEDFIDSMEDTPPGDSDLRLLIGAEIVGQMRDAVWKRTGFRCSAGVAHNKVLAKLCAGLNKPNKQTILPHSSVQKLWEETSVKKVRNLGGKLGDVLVEKLNCKVMSDVARISEKELARHVGGKAGSWLYHLSQEGHDDEAVTPRHLPQSIGCNKNFMGPETLTTKERVRHWVRQLAAEVHERLEKDFGENQRRARTLTLHVSFEEGSGVSRACRIGQYGVERIFEGAWGVMEKLYQQFGVLPVTMLGLIASKFEDERDIPGQAKISQFCQQTATAESTAPEPKPSTSTTANDPTPSSSSSPFPKNPQEITPRKPPPPLPQSSSSSSPRKPLPQTSPLKPDTSTLHPCDRCGKPIPTYDYVTHMDYHTARDISREINGLPPLGFDLRPETLEANEREREKRLASPGKSKKGVKRGRGGAASSSSYKRGKKSPAKMQMKSIQEYFNKVD